MLSERVGDHRLDDIAMGDGHPQRRGTDICLDPSIGLPNRRDGPGGHRRQRLTGILLAVGEPGGTGLVLDHPPQGVLGKLGQRATGPGAVAALPQPVVIDHLVVGGPLLQQSRGSLLTPGQRGAHHQSRRESGCSAAPPELSGLLDPDLVKVDLGEPAGEHARGVRRRPAVPDENHCRHDGHDTAGLVRWGVRT